MSSANRVKDGGEKGGAAAATCQTFLSAEALLGCVDASATGGLSKIGLAFAFLLAFVDEALDPTQGVVARPADLTADIDADGAIADGADVELGTLDVGLELLGEEVAQLLDGEPLDVEGAQARQVDGSVGSDREGAAQLGDVEQLDLESVAGAEDVAVVGDARAFRDRESCR